MKSTHPRRNRQKGAALVVGLMLLVIVTVLAVSAVGTASTELVMAGNEQYRERAFQAAEIGVETGIRKLATIPQDYVAHPDPAVAVTSLPSDNYVVSSIYLGEDDDIPGYSAGKFVGLHYRIDSTGNSQRNAKSVHAQGAYVVGSGGGNGYFPPINSLGAP
jgi:type IV pilus assembly protein PilX